MYLTQGLHRALRHTPERPATIFGDRIRSVAEHADRVARLAGGLHTFGVSDGERVAILSLNSDRYCELLLAVPWADGVLNPVNVRWSPAEIVYSLVDSDTSLLVVDDTFAPLVPELREGHPGLRTVIHAGDGDAPDELVAYEELATGPAAVPDARRGGDAAAGVFYTGGTTGFPKGVVLTHANLLTSALGSQATCPWVVPGGRGLLAAPLFHAAGLAPWLVQSVVGGTHVLLPAFDPVAVMRAIAAHRVTSTVLVPTMLQRVVDHPDLGRHDLTSLRILLYAGSAIGEALLLRAIEALPATDFVQAYGMTELGPIATMLTAEDHRRGDRLRSAGRAAVHAEVRVVDEVGNEAPRGTVGEVAVRGGHVMAGYWAKPKETAAAVRGDWMHTGDAGYMDDAGYVFIVDRLKDMIVSGGENVYSVEVENALSRHPAVAACAVIGVPDLDWGERVHAVVVLEPGARATLDDLRAHVTAAIAGYKAPRSVEFVDELPVSGAGKVQKAQLRARPSRAFDTAGHGGRR
ncbi:MAG TPA: long-chain fatty acid--CoA ligase [Acidimicrobiales bacterium]|nr:long-chain fatty acid--CoA ligase [Acidimicrobiales bacterium]